MNDESKSKTNGASMPVFDFSRLGWKDAKASLALVMRLKFVGIQLDEKMSQMDSAEFERVMAEYNALMLDMQQHTAQVVVKVPRDWLVTDAPATLDWGDPASYDYLQQGKWNELQRLIREKLQPEEVSGN